jgi:hypothetical protein
MTPRLLGPARCGGVVDGISSMTVWCYGGEFPWAGVSPMRGVRVGGRSSTGGGGYVRVASALALALSYIGAGAARVTPPPTLGRRPRWGQGEPPVISFNLI